MTPEKLIALHQAEFGEEPLGIICRHAERPHLDRHTAYQGLTPGGVSAAIKVGEQIKGDWRVFASPVERCKQTALSLSWGICFSGGRSRYVGDLGVLGGDSLYVNHEAAMDVVFSKRLWDYMPDWKAGRMPAFARFEDFHIETCRKLGPILDEGRAIFVSHDINLIVLADCAGQSSDKQIYFNFLEGLTLQRSGEMLGMFAWHEGRPTGTWVPSF